MVNEIAAAHEAGLLEPDCAVRLTVIEPTDRSLLLPTSTRAGKIHILVKRATEKSFTDVTPKIHSKEMLNV